MKKLTLFIMAMAASFALQAQWVDDPINNNHIANSPDYSGEIIVATDTENGDTYVQWTSGGSNGYGPTLQRLTFDGTPQWGDDGIRIMGQNFYSSSDGHAMAVTADHAVVSCFATASDQTVAVKINADGTYAWGEQGVVLFDGNGFSRAEIIAGDDGGAWALGCTYESLFLQYIKSDGSLYPYVTIEEAGASCRYGQLTLGVGNSVFLTYEKTPSSGGFWTDKEIHLVGYTVDGIQIGPDVLLMSSQTFQVTYIHYVVPDGLGGAYAYIWHSGIGSAFNTYVFHYDANGFSTISDTNGIPVHSADPANFYRNADATVDPVSHDLLITYQQTDANTQSTYKIYVNRITATGERVWDDGILVYDNGTNGCGGLNIDAFEDGSGFAIVYYKSNSNSDDGRATVEAVGYDMEGNVLWNKQLCSANYPKSSAETSSGFHMGQNIVTWVNTQVGGIIGQNFAPDGTMGEVTPELPCPGLENLEGQYVYDAETQTFGAMLTWNIPEDPVDFYRLYRTDVYTEEETVIDFGGDAVSYFDAVEVGLYKYQLRAQFADVDCGLSDPATTYNGQDYVYIDVTGIDENESQEIVTLVRIINAKGQTLQSKDLNELNSGLYILQGTTKEGKMVSKKVVVKK